ncbi:ribosome-inactivating family protein [Streptomyces sp. NPDC004296]|uniref:ribosome-inactivating family protein n=1 Tax=Streptomyces sp. NPDC004296 TaxID=3364697 RepID=UPI003679DBC9
MDIGFALTWPGLSFSSASVTREGEDGESWTEEWELASPDNLICPIPLPHSIDKGISYIKAQVSATEDFRAGSGKAGWFLFGDRDVQVQPIASADLKFNVALGPLKITSPAPGAPISAREVFIGTADTMSSPPTIYLSCNGDSTVYGQTSMDGQWRISAARDLPPGAHTFVVGWDSGLHASQENTVMSSDVKDLACAAEPVAVVAGGAAADVKVTVSPRTPGMPVVPGSRKFTVKAPDNCVFADFIVHSEYGSGHTFDPTVTRIDDRTLTFTDNPDLNDTGNHKEPLTYTCHIKTSGTTAPGTYRNGSFQIDGADNFPLTATVAEAIAIKSPGEEAQVGLPVTIAGTSNAASGKVDLYLDGGGGPWQTVPVKDGKWSYTGDLPAGQHTVDAFASHGAGVKSHVSFTVLGTPIASVTQSQTPPVIAGGSGTVAASVVFSRGYSGKAQLTLPAGLTFDSSQKPCWSENGSSGTVDAAVLSNGGRTWSWSGPNPTAGTVVWSAQVTADAKTTLGPHTQQDGCSFTPDGYAAAKADLTTTVQASQDVKDLVCAAGPVAVVAGGAAADVKVTVSPRTSGMPVVPGSRKFAVKAPDNCVFADFVVHSEYGSGHTFDPTVTRIDDRTLTFTDNPDLNDTGNHKEPLTYTCHIKTSSATAPGTYRNGSFQIDGADNFPLTATVTVEATLSVQEVRVWPQALAPSSGDVFFSWKVTNTGPSAARTVHVSVALPEGVTVSDKYTLDGQGHVQMDLTDLPVGESRWFRIAGHTDSPSGNAVTATAQVTAVSGDTGPSNATIPVASGGGGAGGGLSCNWLTDIFSFVGDSFGAFAGLADFSGLPFGGGDGGLPDPDEPDRDDPDKEEEDRGVTMLKIDNSSAAPTPAVPGQDKVTFTWTVKNTGSRTDARFVVALVQLPKDFLFIDGPTGCVDAGGGRIMCPLTQDLAAQHTVDLKITASVPAPVQGNQEAWAYVSALNAWPASKKVTLRTDPHGAWALTEGTASPNPVARGQQVTYNWTLTNNGPSEAHETVVTVAMPDHTHTVSASAVLDGTTYPGTRSGNDIIVKMPSVPTTASGAHSVRIAAQGTVADDAKGALAATVKAVATGTPEVNREATAQTALPDLVITGQAFPRDAVAGREATFVWTVANNGNHDATNAVVTAVLPDGCTYVTASGGGTGSGRNITWPALGTLAQGAQATVTLTARLAVDAIGDLTPVAQASVSADKADSPPPATAPLTAHAMTVLGLEGAPHVSPATRGHEITYGWTMTNNGPSTAHDAVFATILPAGVAFTSLEVDGKETPAQGADPSWAAPLPKGLAPGAPVSVTVTARLADCQTGFLTCEGAITTADDRAEATAHLEVLGDTTLLATAGADTFSLDAGTSHDLTWTVAKAGTSPLLNPQLILDLPPAATVASATVDGISEEPVISANGRTVIPVTTLVTQDHSTVTATLALAPDAPATTGAQLEVTAVAEASGTPTSPPATTHLTVTTNSHLAIAPVTITPLRAGADARLEWTVTNTGPSTAVNTLFTATLPTAFSLDEAYLNTHPQTPAPAGANTCRLPVGDLAPGTSAQITLAIHCAPDTGGQQDLTATVTAGTAQPVTQPSRVTVNAGTALQLAVQATPDPALVGKDVTHVITVTNAGAGTLKNLRLTTVIDNSAYKALATSANGTWTTTAGGQTTVTWPLDDLPPAAQATATLIGRLADSSSGTLTAHHTATSDNAPEQQSTTDTAITNAPARPSRHAERIVVALGAPQPRRDREERAPVIYNHVSDAEDAASRENYKAFIDAFRGALTDREVPVPGIAAPPIPATNSEAVKQFIHIQVTRDGEPAITLVIRRSDAYLVGWYTDAYVDPEAKAEIARTLFIRFTDEADEKKANYYTPSVDRDRFFTLTYDGNYNSLGERKQIPLGCTPLDAALEQLHNFTAKKDQYSLKNPLTTVIQMASEATRFNAVFQAITFKNKTEDRWRDGKIPEQAVRDLENAWKPISDYLLIPEPGDTFSEAIGGKTRDRATLTKWIAVTKGVIR